MLELIRVIVGCINTGGTRNRVDKILDGGGPSQVVGYDKIINNLLHGGCGAVKYLPEVKGTDLLRDLPLQLPQETSIKLEKPVDSF